MLKLITPNFMQRKLIEESQDDYNKRKYRELGQILKEAQIPGETIRAIREMSAFYKHLNAIGGIDVDKIKIKAKDKHRGHGMRFWVRSKKDYNRLKETYGQVSDISFDTKKLLKITYGDSDSKLQTPEVQNDTIA